MAQFLRGKQAGIQRDFSAGLDPGQFAVDIVRILFSSIKLYVFKVMLLGIHFVHTYPLHIRSIMLKPGSFSWPQ